jgi:hypothetical protein
MLNKTDFTDAYTYRTQNPNLQHIKTSSFSSQCIFCSCPQSQALTADGSFRQCLQCRKQFKAQIHR